MPYEEEFGEQTAVVSAAVAERRRAQRIRLQVPMFIRGLDLQGEYYIELTKSINISCLGALIASPRCLPLNGLVTLTIPAPSITSAALLPAGMDPIAARVKRQQRFGDLHLVGLEFQKPLV
jgi:PilZ domain